MPLPCPKARDLESVRRIRRRTLHGLAAGLAAGWLAAGCTSDSGKKPTGPPAEGPKYVLEIGDRKISVEQLNQVFALRLGEFADHTELNHLKSQILQDLVAEHLLDQEAQKSGVTATEEELQMYLRGLESEKTREGEESKPSESLEQEMRRTLRVQRYIREVLMKGYEPDPAQVLAYYNEHLDEFMVAESVHVREILLRSADLAERVLEMLKAAQYRNFSQLAKQYSIAPSSVNGGDMGTFARGDLPEEMEKVFFSMNVPGKVTQIIQTKYGYHVFMLVERTREHRETFGEVKERISSRLSEERQKQLMAEKVKQLQGAIAVRLYRQNLDFSYNGQEFQGGSYK